MHVEYLLIHEAKDLLEAMDGRGDATLMQVELAEIVRRHSLGAAAAGLATGWIPGAGGMALVLVTAGYAQTMYGKINEKIGLPMADDIAKSLATGVAADLATHAVGAVVLCTVFSLLPGLGSVGASAVAEAASYALTLAAGVVYLKLLTALFRSGRRPTELGVEALKRVARDLAEEEDLGAFIREVRNRFREERQ